MGRAKKIKGHRDNLSGAKRCGRKCRNERRRIEAILWILRTGCGWRDLPRHFGRWQTVYGSFRRWSHAGLWQLILRAVTAANADNEYVLVDSTAVRIHQHGSGPAGGQLAQAMGRSASSLSTKIHLASDALGSPLGLVLTGANVADSIQCRPLLKAHLKSGAYAIMDKGYDSDTNRAYVNQLGGIAVIAVNGIRAKKPPLDQHIYRERHKIENLFARLKAFRRISTRYEKLAVHFSSMLHLACLLVWLKL